MTIVSDEKSERAVAEPPRAARPKRRHRAQTVLIIVGVSATLVAAVFGVLLGTSNTGIDTVLSTIWNRLFGIVPSNPEDLKAQTIVWELRMPRILLAILAGTALAIAGTLFQGLLRNPLVSPYTIGTASAAAFGASIAIIVFGSASSSSAWALVAGALIAGGLNTALILTLGASRKLASDTLILLGIALTQLFNALTAGLQYFADSDVLAAIIRWTWGSVNGAQWFQVVALLAVVLVLYPYVQFRSGALNAIAFAGDDAAKSLGVPVQRVRLELISVATVLTAVTISFTGIIGFVGLVGPHIARLIIGANHRFLIPFSAIIGSSLLILADVVGRSVIAPGVLPLGIVDAIIGAPIFIYLILVKRKQTL